MTRKRMTDTGLLRFHRRLQRRRHLQCELLEDRRVLASILFEDFEDATITYSPNPTDSLADIANNDYYGRVAFSALPADKVYANQQGSSFYGAHDIDGALPTSTSTITLDWTGVNIAGFTNLDLSWFVAEDDDPGLEDWDSTDSVRISVQIDGGGFTDVFAIEAEENPIGDQINNAPRVDTDFDGIGDGALITNSFTQFNTAIADGSTLDIRLTIEQLNAADEDIGFDNLLLQGDVADFPPALLSFVRNTPATSPTNADSLTFRATFSEDVQNVSSGDFDVSGTTATVTTVTPVSGSVYDLTVSGGDLAGLNGTVGIDLAAGQNITDTTANALPAGEPATDETYVVDNTAPATVSFQRSNPATSPTHSDTLVFRATFGEDVSNVDPADFAVTGTTATIAAVAPVSGSVYDVTVAGGDLPGLNGTVGLDLAGGQNITDLAGNALPAGEPATDETYTVDNVGAPVTLLFEDFEDAILTYTPTPADSLTDLAVNNYFGRIAFSALSANVVYSNQQGTSFYGAQDMDNAQPTATASVVLNWTGINIAGFTNLDLSWFVAEDDDGALEDWDSTDSVRLAIQIDGGGFNDIFAIEAEEFPIGDQINNAPRVDTDFDGIGDGTEITDVFTQFSSAIADGSTLDIRLTIEQLNAADEDIGFDNLLLIGDPVDVPPALLSFERNTPATSPTNADSLVFRATFSEDVQNVSLGDFDVTGTTATVTTVTPVSGSVYDLTVSGGDLAGLDGTVGIDLAAGQDITDTTANALPAGEPATDETYLVDNTAPATLSFQRSNPATSPTHSDTLVFRATFSEDVTNVDVSDFAVSGTTASVAAVAPVSGSVYDVTVAGGDLPGLNGTVGLDLAGGQDITDSAGNALPAGEPATDETYVLDNVGAPVTLLFEDFEDAVITYTPTPADSLTDLAINNYFGRIAFSALSANVVYSNQLGTSFYGAQDIDSAPPTGTNTVVLDWTGINISGFINLNMSWFVAEDDDGALEDWDSTDSVRLAIQIDGGGFNDIFAIEAEEFPIGDQVNNAPRVDTNFDGIGDGTEITDVFTQFSTAIANGSTLDIRLTIEQFNAADEDIGFDNLLVTGELPDTDPPVLLSFERQNPPTSPTNADTLTFRATFNEDVQNVSAADFLANGSNANSVLVTPISGTVYDVTVFGGNLASFNGTVGVDLNSSQNITDLAGNLLPNSEPAIDETYEVDNVAPVFSSIVRWDPATSPTDSDTLEWLVTFNEPVSNVSAIDFAATGASPTTILTTVVSDQVYRVKISGGDLPSYNGIVGLDLAAGQDITDKAGNPLPNTEPAIDETYLLDNTPAGPPTLLSFERQNPATSPTNADMLTFRATFSEDVLNVSAADFLANGSTANSTLVSPISGTVYDVTIFGGNLASFNGTVGVDLGSSQDITDLAGNPLPNGEPAIDETYEVDNVAPVFSSIVRWDPATSLTNSDTLEWLVTFNEPVSNVSAIDFATTGASPTTILTTVVSDQVYRVKISGGDLPSYNGIVGLDLAAGQDITDKAGNPLPNTEPAIDETYLLDNLAPTLLAFERHDPATSPTDADVLVFRATFDEDVSNVSTGDFAVSGTTATVSSVAPVSGSVYDVTVSGGDLPGLNGIVGLNLAAGQDIEDLTGNPLPLAEPAIDETYEVINPNVVFVSSDTGGTVAGIDFDDEDILAYNIDSGGWAMYFDGSQVGLSSKDIDGFLVQSDGSILLSVDAAISSFAGLGRVEDSDVLRFIPTAHGVNTAGSFEFYLDGSDVGLSPTSEDITAIALDPTGRLVVSTVSNHTVPTSTGTVSGTSDDLIVLNATQLGADSIGTWETYFDGSDIGLNSTNVYGASIAGLPATPTIHLTTKNSFSVTSGTSLSGDHNDIFSCNTTTTGDSTACVSITELIDMGSVGFGSENLDGIQFGNLTGNEVFGNQHFYFSSDGGGTVGGVTFADDDIIVQDTSTGAWSMHFDGSDVGISNDVNAFHIEPSGDILMSFQSSQNVAGLGTVTPQDIVRFSPTSTGDNTAGSFSFFFDGSDVGLTTYYENIDSIGVDPVTGDLVISTTGNHDVPASVGNVTGNNRDLIRFLDVAFGSNTIGVWASQLSGASVGLDSTSEDISGLWYDNTNGETYVNTKGSYSIPGLAGTRADIFAPAVPTLLYDSLASGISNILVDGIFVKQLPPPPAPPAAIGFAASGPQIEDVVIDNGSAQRSTIRSITVNFDSAVTIDDGAFAVTSAEGVDVDVNVDVFDLGGRTQAVLQFGGSLADGRYQLEVRDALIRDAAGNRLDGDGDGIAGNDRVDEFFRLFGDADGSGAVDLRDYSQFRSAYGNQFARSSVNAAFDHNDDSLISLLDLVHFRENFGRRLS